ncbi:esterase-like activity of phytase family protein [Epibacterium ulvae]|uniref:esterase-like activity of phytase family protein n=1 Tax=Epibacterium ulvae TaxID=1156985 RepID=UPI001BFC7F74|nr:esterase-like activity of phytase family protein [Epibacterium ulvae]MBT8153260.1 esterase-like activity of phytase family protein [Epibacterium ulvae]
MRRRFAIKLIFSMMLGGGLAVAAYAAGRSGDGMGPARFLSSYVLTAKPSWFGGFSALALDETGQRVVVLTDRSHLVGGFVKRTANKIDRVTFDTHVHLRNADGQIMRHDRDSIDSEGIAIGQDGALFVSFEGKARVSRYAEIDGQAEDLPRIQAFAALQENKALEALAIDPAGRLYTLPEKSAGAAFPVWRWDGADWQTPFHVEKRNGYLPVGLDIGPDGRFYLLERKFVLIGFRSRLRRWDFVGDALQNETVLLTTPLRTHDNLEGLSVWRSTDGDLRATMVSDNNFMPFQRSELVEYQLPE